MIQAILDGLMSLASWLVGVVTAPIDIALVTLFPDIRQAMGSFASFLEVVRGYVGVMASYLFIPDWLWVLYLGLFQFGIAALVASTVIGFFKWLQLIKVW